MTRRRPPKPTRASELADAVPIAEVARLLGVCSCTVQRMIRAGHLQPFYLPGSGRPRIPLDQVVAIRRRKTPPPPSLPRPAPPRRRSKQ